jgi:hypothetical protein
MVVYSFFDETVPGEKSSSIENNVLWRESDPSIQRNRWVLGKPHRRIPIFILRGKTNQGWPVHEENSPIINDTTILMPPCPDLTWPGQAKRVLTVLESLETLTKGKGT